MDLNIEQTGNVCCGDLNMKSSWYRESATSCVNVDAN